MILTSREVLWTWWHFDWMMWFPPKVLSHKDLGTVLHIFQLSICCTTSRPIQSSQILHIDIYIHWLKKSVIELILKFLLYYSEPYHNWQVTNMDHFGVFLFYFFFIIQVTPWHPLQFPLKFVDNIEIFCGRMNE